MNLHVISVLASHELKCAGWFFESHSNANRNVEKGANGETNIDLKVLTS